jgi:hypothetical protein
VQVVYSDMLDSQPICARCGEYFPEAPVFQPPPDILRLS